MTRRHISAVFDDEPFFGNDRAPGSLEEMERAAPAWLKELTDPWDQYTAYVAPAMEKHIYLMEKVVELQAELGFTYGPPMLWLDKRAGRWRLPGQTSVKRLSSEYILTLKEATQRSNQLRWP